MLGQALNQLAAALEQRVATAPFPESVEKARRLRNHVVNYLLPRATDLLAPLLVVILGSTGSGKSSLFNALAGKPVSPSGLLRPTTRKPVALVNPADSPNFPDLTVITDALAPKGLMIVDSPDFDSVELGNRQLALDLLEEADLVIFITTVTRYADQVPWLVLERARQRGVPLLMVINRMPIDRAEQEEVITDFRALLKSGGLNRQGAFGDLEVVSVPEGALDSWQDAISPEPIIPIRSAIEGLRDDDAARRSVARRSLVTALHGLPASIAEVAQEVAFEQEASQALLSESSQKYRRGLAALSAEVESGNFLRTEVLEQWLDFVRAGPLARFISEGVGKIAASIRDLFRNQPPPPAPPVREAAFSDLVASARRHADDAARGSATIWADDRHGARALAENPQLWAADPNLEAWLRDRLAKWVEEISAEIAALGQQRRAWARAASAGLNVIGTSAMIAVFVHTGGLTGTEVGIGAATAFVNQKLLEAIFGEANVSAFVKRARSRLLVLLTETFDVDRDRFDSVLGPVDTDLGGTLRRLASEARAEASQI